MKIYKVTDEQAREVYISTEVFNNKSSLKRFFTSLVRPYFCVSTGAWCWSDVPDYVARTFGVRCRLANDRDMGGRAMRDISRILDKRWNDTVHFFIVDFNPFSIDEDEVKRVQSLNQKSEIFDTNDLVIS